MSSDIVRRLDVLRVLLSAHYPEHHAAVADAQAEIDRLRADVATALASLQAMGQATHAALSAPAPAPAEPVAHSDKRVTAIMALVDEFAEAKRRAPLATYTSDVRAEIERSLRLTVDAAPSAPAGWQPIETAPKDGTLVMLWLRYPYSKADVLRWEPSVSGWVSDYWHQGSEGFCGSLVPSHWMPLPAAPGAQGDA